MNCYPMATVERRMKIQEVILRAMAKITWWQAAEIIGIRDRPAVAGSTATGIRRNSASNLPAVARRSAPSAIGSRGSGSPHPLFPDFHDHERAGHRVRSRIGIFRSGRNRFVLLSGYRKHVVGIWVQRDGNHP
jgi:hypothetical protein